MEDIEDFDTIDIEVDEWFKTIPEENCTEEFFSTLSEAALEDCVIPDVEVDEDEANEAQAFENEGNEEQYEAQTGKFRYNTHDSSVKWNKMIPTIGERFETPQQLKLCLTNYAIHQGYKIKFKKSDSVRVYAVCGSDQKFRCPYMVRASWMSNERSFQIKKMDSHHTCVRTFDNSNLMNPTWLARQFLKELIRKPDMKCSDIQTAIQSKFHASVSWSKAYRAKIRAMSLIHGRLADHYAKVWDYGHELMRSNPGSTVKISVRENVDGTTTFERMYICFKAISDGWKAGCRRVIGLDGAFLKGQCKGELLTAIGRDANNQVYPIAWAVVGIENKANWMWFLQLVHDDLELQDGRGVCVISDQHKGLLEATKDILPHVEHKQCARHIYANFRKVFSGVEMKNMFWAAAMSTVEGQFMMNMEKIKDANPAAYAHLMAREPGTWCRAYLSDGFACESIENGMAECFNSIIVKMRNKPLLTMLEEIRLYIMQRMYTIKKDAEKWSTQVCPATVKKMEKFGEDIRYLLLTLYLSLAGIG